MGTLFSREGFKEVKDFIFAATIGIACEHSAMPFFKIANCLPNTQSCQLQNILKIEHWVPVSQTPK